MNVLQQDSGNVTTFESLKAGLEKFIRGGGGTHKRSEPSPLSRVHNQHGRTTFFVVRFLW